MKSKCIKLRLILFTTLILSVAATPALALFSSKVKHFSADMVTIEPSGKVVNTGTLHVSDDVIRMDGIGSMMGPQKSQEAPDLSMLTFQDKGIMYFYNHDKKLVYEGPLEEEDMMAGYKAMDNIESEKVLGKEKVSGYKCVKKEVVTRMQVMGRTIKNKLIVWESDQFEFPLRSKMDDGSIQEMRNIKEGKPPKKLMQPLTGYTKVGSMMAVMGMDFGAMMAQESAMEEEKETQTMPKTAHQGWSNKAADATPSPDQQNQEQMDISKMMEQMSQAMGENMGPEEKAQMMQAMNQAMNQANQTKEGPGAAKRIWQIIPRKPGDKVGSELKTTNVLNVSMGSRAPLTDVFDFYKNKLTARGWKDQGMYLQNGQGSMHMTKGQQSLTISSEENSGIKGNFSTFYMMQLNGPNL